MELLIKENLGAINALLKGKSAEEIIAYFLNKLGDKITFGTSMGAEDQVITEIISKIDLSAEVFTLDTGRLFPETYDLIDSTARKYKLKIKTYFPEKDAIEKMVFENGINLFYNSIELRKHCCQLRKLDPLKRALVGKKAWFTGLRRSQSVTRVDMQIVEWDNNSSMFKINPLIDWSEKDVWDYIKTKKIPYNTLHDKNYPSIGCQPCTRAIEDGEDVRAGRWWWENPDTRECGLHE